MEIIPAIDIAAGKVIHANGSSRQNYPPLKSLLSQSGELHELIRDLLDYYPFTSIYIADLDAIERNARNMEQYQLLASRFPNTHFWIDAGIRSLTDWQQCAHSPSITPVLGSETIIESEWLLNKQVKENSVLSLDFADGVFLGEPALLANNNLWPTQVIVMELAHVGRASGPNLANLVKLQQRSPDTHFIAAGGIRNRQDLVTIAQHGVQQALVASALHDGRLNPG